MQVRSANDIDYIPAGDYFIPALTLPCPSKHIGKWGRIYRDFLKNHHPVQYNSLILSGQLWEILAQINEQIQDRLDRTVSDMAAAEAVTQNSQRHGSCGGCHRGPESRRSPRLGRSHEQHPQPCRGACSAGTDLGGRNNMSVLEELWYGNLEPSEFDSSSSKEYKELLHLVGRNEEKLLATMTDEQKELFSRYSDCVREFQALAECLLFQRSFQLGARMMAEVMEE